MWGLFRGDKSKGPSRAQRFQVQMPLHFRKVGEFSWNVAKTKNISRSGVLFQAGQILKTDTPVEIQFVVPAQLGSDAGEIAQCQGKIVRTLLPPATDQRPALAAKFSQYRVVRKQGDW